MNNKSAKILVVGDSGVGKSSLIHLICHSTTLSSTQWTIGCSIDVKQYGDCWLEFWDIGGSRGHKIARSFLYNDYDAIILVFDATNIKSRLNLEEWLMEITQGQRTSVPTLMIATRRDQVSSSYQHSVANYNESSQTPLLGNQVILIDARDNLSFAAFSDNHVKLNNFFKLVLDTRDKKFYNNKYYI